MFGIQVESGFEPQRTVQSDVHILRFFQLVVDVVILCPVKENCKKEFLWVNNSPWLPHVTFFPERDRCDGAVVVTIGKNFGVASRSARSMSATCKEEAGVFKTVGNSKVQRALVI